MAKILKGKFQWKWCARVKAEQIEVSGPLRKRSAHQWMQRWRLFALPIGTRNCSCLRTAFGSSLSPRAGRVRSFELCAEDHGPMVSEVNRTISAFRAQAFYRD